MEGSEDFGKQRSFLTRDKSPVPKATTDIEMATKYSSRNHADPPAISDAPAIRKPTVCRTIAFDSGYEFSPDRKWIHSVVIGLTSLWKFFITPFGFVVTIYSLNVIAWGGMLFLLLCNAAPSMCHPSCDNINSSRRIWIEIDSQILNGLFCVTGFGTIPWRFRDLYLLLLYRIRKEEMALRRLAGTNRGWFRLAGSEGLPVELGPENIGFVVSNIYTSTIPYPSDQIPNAPFTGIRAPATSLWKLDFAVWAMVMNTFFQTCLAGVMWGFDRHDRPSWCTGLFMALACLVAGCGAAMSFVERRKVKGIEGLPVSAQDQERLRSDRELGVTN